RTDKPDIVYCAHKKPLLPVLLLKRLGLLKARVIFHVHLIVPPRFIHRAFHALARATADVLICVSRRVFDQWEGGRRELVYNPIPPEVLIQKSPWTPGQPLRVGFVGSTTYLKGFDLFLEIAKKLGGSDRKPGYDFRVFTRTPVPEQDVPVTYFQESTGADIYRNMDVLLICSRAEESFSLTALEAAANHIPVVFPGQAALLEILTPEISGEMYQQSRVQDMVAALETLARRLEEDPRACQPQSEELLRRYSLEVFRDRMREIFSGSDYPHASPDKGQTP
ncbi:MAG: glycosyltransferase, partial [Deltaproteobacteria bacterium]|nr:glycosyltransferase [Deltaproteobacteria bacterium]